MTAGHMQKACSGRHPHYHQNLFFPSANASSIKSVVRAAIYLTPPHVPKNSLQSPGVHRVYYGPLLFLG